MGCGGVRIIENESLKEKERNIKKRNSISDENTNIIIGENNKTSENNKKFDIKLNKENLYKVNNIINNKVNDQVNNKLDNKANNKDNDNINRMFKKHLELREMHGCSDDLKLDDELLNKMAHNRAIKLLYDPNNIFSGDLYKDEILGENIFISDKILDPEEICNEWYKEGENYDYENNRFQKGKGHFTQLIWKNTKKVGFGFGIGIQNNKKKMVVVAYYYPSGNIFGEFKNNVKKKIKLK